MKIKVLLASPRGYCAGVRRAIEIVDLALKEYGTPLYVNHEIIHNKFIINHFEKKGVVFGEDIEKIPEGNIIIFSAHGVGPEFIQKVRNQKLKFLDASCPLVIKVHKEAKSFLEDGYEIIYIGEKNHVEAKGVKENGSDKIHIISSREDLEALCSEKKNFLNTGTKLALLNQTTLSIDDISDFISDIQKKLPQIQLPKVQDICYATTNRQTAVKEICKKSDCLIIVGSKNSSNSTKLRYIGEKVGIPSFQIDSYKELEDNLSVPFNKGDYGDSCTIGISGGASAPEKLVQEVISYLKEFGDVEIEEITVADEKMIFPSKLVLQV